MATISVANLITRVRTRSDTDLDPSGNNHSVVTDAQILEFINDAWRDLYSLLTGAKEDLFLSSSDLITDGTSDLTLPSGFWILRGVDITISGEKLTLAPYGFQERNKLQSSSVNSLFNETYFYRLKGAQYPGDQEITIQPTPASGLTVTVWYVPEPTVLSSGGDDFNVPSLWEQFIVVYAASMVAEKEESFQLSQILMGRKNQLQDRIVIDIMNRDNAIPHNMQDARKLNDWWIHWGSHGGVI